MEMLNPIDTSDLSVDELKIVSEKVEKALDSCIARSEVVENRLAIQYRTNLLGALSAIAALTTGIDIFTIPALILLVGNIAAAIIVLLATKTVETAYSGTTWRSFKLYKNRYGINEEGLLRYSIDACLEKIRTVVKANRQRAKLLDYSLWTAIATLSLSTSVLLILMLI